MWAGHKSFIGRHSKSINSDLLPSIVSPNGFVFTQTHTDFSIMAAICNHFPIHLCLLICLLVAAFVYFRHLCGSGCYENNSF